MVEKKLNQLLPEAVLLTGEKESKNFKCIKVQICIARQFVAFPQSIVSFVGLFVVNYWKP